MTPTLVEPRSSAHIHPTAHIDPTATIDPTARLHAEAFVGPHCVIGPRCELRPRAMVVSHTTLGEGNTIHPYAVIGGDPQDRKFKPERPGALVVGDNNIFREGVTISRSTDASPATRIGSRNYLMVNAHLGHDCVMGDDNTIANGAHIAGHVIIGNRIVAGGGIVIHQFCMIGDGAMFQGLAGTSQHVPPYVVVKGINFCAGLNIIGLRRNPNLTDTERTEIRELYRAIFRSRGGRPFNDTIADLRARRWSPAASRFIDFVENATNSPDTNRHCGVITANRHPRA